MRKYGKELTNDFNLEVLEGLITQKTDALEVIIRRTMRDIENLLKTKDILPETLELRNIITEKTAVEIAIETIEECLGIDLEVLKETFIYDNKTDTISVVPIPFFKKDLFKEYTTNLKDIMEYIQKNQIKLTEIFHSVKNVNFVLGYYDDELLQTFIFKKVSSIKIPNNYDEFDKWGYLSTMFLDGYSKDNIRLLKALNPTIQFKKNNDEDILVIPYYDDANILYELSQLGVTYDDVYEYIKENKLKDDTNADDFEKEIRKIATYTLKYIRSNMYETDYVTDIIESAFYDFETYEKNTIKNIPMFNLIDLNYENDIL